MSAPTPRPARRALALALVCLTALGAAPRQQPEEGDDELVAATWHKLTGRPLDYARAAEGAEAVRRATSFDRPDAVQGEVARLRALVGGAEPAHDFTLRVDDRVSDYDHASGEFSVELFRPGAYVPIRAFGEEYRLVFANADRARAIAMPKEAARAFDARLAAMGRGVVDELRYRVVGAGDPAGGVTGANVVRAELLAVRLLDRNGAVVFTPSLAAPATVAKGAAAPSAVDVATADVAGFRVGVKAKELETTLTRLFGPVERRDAGRGAAPGVARVLAVNELGCTSLPGRRRGGEPGAVCVTALADDDDVVRSVRVERVFPWMEAELFRRTMVGRYGPVAAAEGSGGLTLGWGPEVAAGLRYGSGPANALTAHYLPDEDVTSRGLNALPRIRVVLQLVDAAWAAEHAR